MEKWEHVKLGDVAELSGGYAFKSSQYTEQGRVVVRTINIRDDCSITLDGATYISEDEAAQFSKFSLRDMDTLFVMVAATLGKIGFVRSDVLPALLNQNMWVIRAKPGRIEPVFLHYCFRELSRIPLAWVSGSARSFLRRDDVRNLKFHLPPLPEQRAIAHILGTLDDKIELNRRMNETLEAMARGLFKDWFVDFGPTRAKSEGRDPYLAPEIWDLFPNALDEEDKPEGWSFAPLTALAEMNPESWSRKNTPEEVEYVDLANTKWGTIEATQQLRWQDAPSRAKRILRPGDTIVGMVRPGNGSFAFVSDSGLTGSTGFAVLRSHQARYTELVFLSATAPENIERLANLADGAAYPAVRPEVVGATEVAFCEDAVATSFSELASPILDRMESNKRENHTLAQTRDLLLPKLMSGEVRVSDVVEIVQDFT